MSLVVLFTSTQSQRGAFSVVYSGVFLGITVSNLFAILMQFVICILSISFLIRGFFSCATVRTLNAIMNLELLAEGQTYNLSYFMLHLSSRRGVHLQNDPISLQTTCSGNHNWCEEKSFESAMGFQPAKHPYSRLPPAEGRPFSCTV